MIMNKFYILIPLSFFGLFGNLYAKEKASEKSCYQYGPQTPRDIDKKSGTNSSLFSLAPSYKNMNLCNMHFHLNAEHKSKLYSVTADNSKIGFQCNATSELSDTELKPIAKNYCKGIKPGDTIEVHWVHSSCQVKPGKGLGSCLSKECTNPDLRVEGQVFLLVNDSSAMNFNDLAYDKNVVNGYHQAKNIPSNTGSPLQYLGSATGEELNNKACSTLSVSWGIRSECAKLDINSLSNWCKDNVFKENYAHGSRPLVSNLKLLSEMK